MKRMSLPPSKRPKPKDWKGPVARLAVDLFKAQRDRRPLAGRTALRSHALEQIRSALGPATSAVELRTVAGAIRAILEEGGYDWSTPGAIEPVLIITRHAIDGVPPIIDNLSGKAMTWQRRIAKDVADGVTSHRRAGYNATKIRSVILAAFREAMSDATSDSMFKTFPTRENPKGEICMSTAGMFRFSLMLEDIDWYQPENAAEAMRVVNEALDTELA